MPLDPRADERFHRAAPGSYESYYRDEVLRLREGLRQIIEEDYPATAGNAETWASEILADSHCVNWKGEDGTRDHGQGKG